MQKISRPDVAEILKPLKPFQRRTVDHAFDRLFKASDSTARFLVADEVGLGKTLVARGIIAKTIEHLWETTERIDIIYICSNASIARSNLPKLQVGAATGRSFALATRLTMLAEELARNKEGVPLSKSKLNFVSFTPRTSFKFGHAGGRAEERVVLFRLLKAHVERRTGLMNLLQGEKNKKKKDDWRRRLAKDIQVDPFIERDFAKSLRETDLLERIAEAIDEWFGYYRERWPAEARSKRNELIADLRKLLAESCLKALEPDLVIMDEFQRFKSLLDNRNGDGAAELAQRLFTAKTPEGAPVRTLLLSATPYKLYTTDAEIGHEDHYEDFIATTRFLFNDNDRVQSLGRQISRFGNALKRASQGLDHDIEEAKGEVEAALRTVMSRTERVIATDDKDAMLAEHANSTMPLVDDVRQYLAADALFRAVGDYDPIRYWKSAPYLANFMRGYGFNRKLDEALSHSPDKIVNIVQNHRAAFIAGQEVDRWQEIEPANAKLREQVSRLLDGGLWRLLWLPPTVPYCSLEGPFRGMEGTTKTLLFSAWNVVPDVVSGVLSYEAERRMVAGSRVRKYQDPNHQQGQRLTLDGESSTSSRAKKRTRHRLLLLLLPCLPLAAIHPLGARREQAEPRGWVRTRVKELLRDLPNPKGRKVDDRWEWVAPLLLDPGLRNFLSEWCDSDLPHAKDHHFRGYVDDLLSVNPCELGRRPRLLPDLLTDVALGSPAVLAARTMASTAVTEKSRRRLAVQVGDAFWSLFNRPAVISLLTRLSADIEHSDSYWRMVLRYCGEGDLGAVLDEQWHWLWEQSGWDDAASADEIAKDCAGKLMKSIRPTPSRVHAWVFDGFEGGSRAEIKKKRPLRTIFALRFGHTDTEKKDDERQVNQDDVQEERRVNQDDVRAAFNSPFRPFVLASTSIGQEGLDFHPWCHRIVHWDLPGNPVDLEQREGRVHRYKGHAVRANVAATWAMDAKAKWKFGDDLWRLLFELADDAARQADESDLQPCWIAPGDTHVERHVPLLPYSREVETFQRLKRQLAAYRVAFGQPRQEELVTLLDRAGLEEAQLRDWAIDLSPPRE